MQRIWEGLVEPSPALADVGDRSRARVLASFLVVLVPLGWLAGVVQLAVVPNFLGRFAAMGAALVVLSVSYGLSRTRHFKVGGVIACLAPPAACVAIGLTDPGDNVWWAFAELGVLLAVIVLPTPLAAGVGGVVAVAVAGVLWFVSPAAHALAAPAIAFHAIVTPLVIVGAVHRNRVEREREQALVDLEAAHRMAIVGHLAGGIAHDFNNLLTVIQSQVPDEQLDGEQAASVAEAVCRASELTGQLFAYARRVATDREIADAAEALKSAERLLRIVAGPGVDLIVEASAVPLPVRVDRSQFVQVLVNLVLNARDAVGASGGRITIRAGEDRSVGHGEPGMAVITVTDTGVGMPEAVRKRVFEPFFTTKGSRGTGLGLSTVRAIAEDHGGRVAVDSTEGVGTTFLVSLPLAAQSA